MSDTGYIRWLGRWHNRFCESVVKSKSEKLTRDEIRDLCLLLGYAIESAKLDKKSLETKGEMLDTLRYSSENTKIFTHRIYDAGDEEDAWYVACDRKRNRDFIPDLEKKYGKITKKKNEVTCPLCVDESL